MKEKISAIKVFSSLPCQTMAGSDGTELLVSHHHNQPPVSHSPQDSGVNDVRPVRGSDDEDVLFAAHSVHLSEDLVDDPV